MDIYLKYKLIETYNTAMQRENSMLSIHIPIQVALKSNSIRPTRAHSLYFRFTFQYDLNYISAAS